MFIVAMIFFGFNVLNLKLLKCRVREEIINVNSNEPSFYPHRIEINKCSGSCNDINDPYAKLCVPDDVKNTNVSV